MICGIVVLYHPDAELVKQQSAAVSGQVDSIIYVDNGGGRAALAAAGVLDAVDTTVLGSGENVGLAAALNRALRAALDGGAEFALLLDHDSIPEPGMVAALVRELGAGAPLRPPAAIGPAIVDMLDERNEYRAQHFARLRLPLNKRIHPRADPAAFEVDFLMTSGTLLRLATLERIGLMDEKLSIDSVDFEWSFRATAAGYSLLATFGARLLHRRGDELHPVIGGRSIRIHSPARLHTMYRNRILLYRRGYVPIAWKLHDLPRMLAKGTLLATVAPHRWANLKAMCCGLRDGVLSRGGHAPLTRHPYRRC